MTEFWKEPNITLEISYESRKRVITKYEQSLYCRCKRSAIGTFLGSLTNVPAAELGATVLKAAIQEAGIEPKDINEVIIGNVISAGLGQNIARHIALDAGIPETIPAHSINMVCGSGLEAVIEATIRIHAGWGDVYVAGGVENMSAAPYLINGKTALARRWEIKPLWMQ